MRLPDFQRDWVWDDEHVRSLLASVSLLYPMGAVMLLQTGNPAVRFKIRLVEGVAPEGATSDPESLILDGQQRLTALFQALMSGQPVTTKDTRKRQIQRWYYMDMVSSLDDNIDRMDTIIAVPPDRIHRGVNREVIVDCSTPEKEYEQHLFPLSKVFDRNPWRRSYRQYWKGESEKEDLYDAFEEQVIDNFEKYELPLIALRKENNKVAVCQVFEKVNTGGVKLTVFELMTATYAADGHDLRHDWSEKKKTLAEYDVLKGLQSDDYLQAVTLLTMRERRERVKRESPGADRLPPISCKRDDILQLSLDDYLKWADPAIEAFLRTAKFMHQQNVFAARDLPYKTQLIPLAAIFAALGPTAEAEGVLKKLSRWYWCGVLGEMYGSAVETRFARDLTEVPAWIEGGPEPDTITAASFIPSRLFTLRTRNSAAYKGIYALLLRDGGQDFKTGMEVGIHMFFDDAIDIHHIFPKKWCQDNGIDVARRDCIVNKTGIAAKTNRMIGGNAPSNYLVTLQSDAEIAEDSMDNILRSHAVDPLTLRSDDFEAFFAQREEALLERISGAMGKPIVREGYEEPAIELVEFEEEEEAV